MKKLTRRMFIKLSALVATVGGTVGLGGSLASSGCGDAKVDDCPEGTTKRELPYGYGYPPYPYWGYGGGDPYICD